MAGFTQSFAAPTALTVTDEAVTFEESDVTVSGYSTVVDGSVQYEPTGYTISDGSYTGTSLDVSSEDGRPQGLAWNGDGSQLYMVGSDTDSVYAYDCSTAYDISTASYSGTSLDVSSETTQPSSVVWNGDGTQLFVLGDTTVYAYDCSTAYDLSTASYSSTSFDVTGEDGGPAGIAWNDDGSQLYMAGVYNGSLYTYDCSTAYDLSTASYSGTSLDVSSEDDNPQGITWDGDGSKLFIVGTGTDSVYRYDCSTVYDLSTASYSGTSLDVSSEATPYGFTWNGDGSELYTAGRNTGRVYAYSTVDSLPVEFTVAWSSVPSDLAFWDLATYQAAPDGGTVTVDVVDSAGTVLFADIGRNSDISTVDVDKEVQLRVTLDGTTGTNVPALDYAARRCGR